MKKNYISNSEESVRMFKNDFLESLSKIHFSVPLFIYVPIIVIFTYKAFISHITIGAYALYFALGILIWTATEYVLHRFIFHYVPKSKWGLRIHFIFHGVHHDYPRDPKRLVMVPSVSLPLAVVFYFLFALFLSPSHLYSFFSGFVFGYLIYDMIHYAIHHANFKSPILKKIKQHHMLHHYDDSSKGYGVSSALWDKILDSDFPKEKIMYPPVKAVPSYDRLFAKKDILFTTFISLLYLLISALLTGLRTDHLGLVIVFNALYFLSFSTRKFVTAFSVYIVYWIVFDYMKAFPNYLYNTVHIESLYKAEKSLFGIFYNNQLLTPNEYWLKHTNSFLDVISGFFYLCWVPLPLVLSTYLYFKKREQFMQLALTFFLVNILGFIVYYTYPAAAPWYVQEYGYNFHASTPGNTAGLHRFDVFFNTSIFHVLYSKSSNVFAAMPSLHSSYPAIVLYYGLKNKLGWVNIIFAVITAGIWFAAVYTSHHYVLDVLAGILCAATVFSSFKSGWLQINISIFFSSRN